MDSPLFEKLFFCRCARFKSLRAASREAGLSPTHGAELISALEARTGAKLFERSAAGLLLTARGEALFRRWREAAETLESLSGEGRAPVFLGISAPTTTGALLIAPALARFSAERPDLKIDLRFTHGSFHPLWDGSDVRIGHGAYYLEDVDTLPLVGVPRIAVASPEYLAAHAPVCEPSDLERPEVFGARDSVEAGGLVLARGSEKRTVRLSPAFTVRNHMASMAIALQGSGIGLLVPRFLARPLIEAGRLVQVLAEWKFPVLTLRAFVSRENPKPEALDLIASLKAELLKNPDLEELAS